MTLPETRDSLLIRLRDANDAAAWDEFAAIYRPMICRLALRRGLQESDAEEIAQRVMLSVSRSIEKWERDPTKGGFRSWLRTVARNAIINHLQRDGKHAAVGGTDFLDACQQIPTGAKEIEKLIDDEYARRVFRVAAQHVASEVQPTTWQAFWRTTMQGQSIVSVAKTLEISVGKVYGARSRVMRLLQQAAATIEAELSLEENSGEGSKP